MSNYVLINDALDRLLINDAGDILLWVDATGTNLNIDPAGTDALSIGLPPAGVSDPPVPILHIDPAGRDDLVIGTPRANVTRDEVPHGLGDYVFDSWADSAPVIVLDGLQTTVAGLAPGAYRFYVKAIDSVKKESVVAAFDDVLIIKPDPPSGLNGFEAAESVRLWWVDSPSSFVKRYRVSYESLDAPPAFTGIVELLQVDGTYALITDIAVGEYRFHVEALDETGLASDAITVDINVTSDQLAFRTDVYDFENPVLTSMHSWTFRDFPNTNTTFYVTAMLGDTFEQSPSTFNQFANQALANFHSSGTSEWTSEVQDFGTEFTGTWVFQHNVQALSGILTVELYMSQTADSPFAIPGNLLANSSSTTGPGVIKGSKTARYGQVKVIATGTETAFVSTPLMNLSLEGKPFEESGSGTSSDSAPVTVSLNRKYGVVREILITSAVIPSPLTATVGVYDNIILDGSPTTEFDVYVFDIDGNQVAVDFFYRFKGL